MSDTSINATEWTADMADAYGQTLVLSRVFENVLKKPDDDEAESSDISANTQVDKSIAFAIAQGITGFGE